MSQAKLLELGEAAGQESEIVKTAEENIRNEHTTMIEELRAAHGSEVEALKAKLEQANTQDEEVSFPI